VSCAGCYLRRLRDCPRDHLCMRAVTAEAVIGRIERMLTNARTEVAAV
jgi:hypothetical protein